jgi:hypothetical protein
MEKVMATKPKKRSIQKKKEEAKPKRRYRWLPEEDKYLGQLHAKGLRLAAIQQYFNEKFGTGRSQNGIESRLHKLGLVEKGSTPEASRSNGLFRELSYSSEDQGTVTVRVEGKLSRNKKLRDKVSRFINDVATLIN